MKRRAFLGGAGALIALPLFRSLLPRAARTARAAAAAAPKRFFAFYVPNGIVMDAWRPPDEGEGFTLSPILQPLAPVKDDVLVLTGLANRPARPDGAGDHASGTGSFLTCTHVFKTEGADIQNGVSLDQVIAGQVGAATRFASLELGLEGGSAAGGCDSGYSCAYARNIAWAGPSSPLPKVTSPRVAFDRLFAGYDPAATQAQIEERIARDRSVLDYSLDQATSLRGKLGRTDQGKLDEYLTAVRELEMRLDDPAVTCTPGAAPGDDPDVRVRVQNMLDLVALAYQCDLTRVVTFMLGNAGSNRTYPFLDIPDAHHEISHHQDDPAKIAKLQTIDTWEVEQLAYLLGKLKAMTDVDGTPVLDSTCVFFSSEIEDGNSHSHYNMPIVVAGKAGGAFKTGRHVVYDGDPPVANLFLSILGAFGVGAPTFGDDGTAPLAGLAG